MRRSPEGGQPLGPRSVLDGNKVTEGARATDYLYDADGNLLVRSEKDGERVLYAGGAELHLKADGKFWAQRFYGTKEHRLTGDRRHGAHARAVRQNASRPGRDPLGRGAVATVMLQPEEPTGGAAQGMPSLLPYDRADAVDAPAVGLQVLGPGP